jgi:hypothetical protein
MNQTQNNPAYAYEPVSQVHNATNERIFGRNIPSKPLQPYLPVRPVSTKFSVLPILEPRMESSVPLVQEPIYSPHKVFNPGNATAPWSGYAAAVNQESELRNQIFALQACSQNTYVPSSTSDLYEYSMPRQHAENQPFPYLFQSERFNPFNPNTEHIGQLSFFNDTRQEIRVLHQKNKLHCNSNGEREREREREREGKRKR